MIERALDDIRLRAIFGAVGLPVSAAALVGFVYGLIFFISGVLDGNLLGLGLGVTAILGFLGILGAWRRILKPYSKMSRRERSVVRFLLVAGVLSSLTLAGASFVFAEWPAAGLGFSVLAIGGVFFVLGTPNAL